MGGLKSYLQEEMVITKWGIIRIGIFGAFFGVILGVGITLLALIS